MLVVRAEGSLYRDRHFIGKLIKGGRNHYLIFNRCGFRRPEPLVPLLLCDGA